GTESLNRFGRVQAPDRKGVVEKDRRKSEGASLRPEAPNEPGVGRTSKKGPNWVSVPKGAHFNASCASTAVCPDFRSWSLIQVTGERAKCNHGRA
ncbi:hypothetical protein ALC56_06065, partial [Trachymyrmex septentrionalis]